MKIIKNIIRFCAAALVALPFVGCQQEELVKPSALMSDSSLTFAATDAEPQMFTIASDDEWMIDVAEDWLTVSPMAGSGTQEITVTVNDNVQGGVVNRPRQSTLTIANKRGYSVTTIIYQNGDNYLGVNEMPISDIVALEDAEFAKVAQAQVMALTSEGFVVTDNSGSIYVKSNADVAVGDVVYLAGEKSTLYGNAVLMAGDVTVKSHVDATYPAAVDLIANLDPANANRIVYVSTYAGLLGTSLKYEQTLPVSVSLVDPKTGVFDLEAVNMHNLNIEAYFLGIDKGDVKLALTKFEDQGINENLKAYFFDDFSWMKSYIEESGQKVGDSVGTDNPSADAPNLRSTAAFATLLEELLARGYEDLNSSAKVIYPQAYYWKFGKTSEATKNNNGGMKLPKMELQGSDLVNIDLEFDWSPHMTGSGNIDKVSVVAEIVEGSGSFDNGTKVSDPFLNECAKGDLKWHHVNTMIRGANNTTRIVIRPYEYASVTPDQQRWHLDNIKVSDSDIPYSDPVYANVTLSDELVTFEGTPAGPFEIKIKSDNPWTLTKGVNTEWFDVDVTEGLPGEEVTVTVTCQESSLSTLRSGSIMLASADTRKNIHVVQSAAGGELDPLVSVVGGNLINIDGVTEEYTFEVLANIDYDILIEDSWLALKEVPATRAIVEKRSHTLSLQTNLTGAARTAVIKFVSKDKKLTFLASVVQDKFEPAISAVASNKSPFVSGLGCVLNYNINSNVTYAVSADADWVKLPAASGPAQNITIPITFSPNTTDQERSATVTFTNEEYNYTTSVKVSQFPAGYVLYEDFSWVAPWANAYGSADSVGADNASGAAPNVYTQKSHFEYDGVGYENQGAGVEGYTSFLVEFANRGLVDINATKQSLYTQKYYLKFGKGNNHTGLQLPALSFDGTAPVNALLTFDWSAHMTGSGNIDKVQLVVEIDGDGVCADSGAKISNPISSTQEKGDLKWQTIQLQLQGVTNNSRITIRPTHLVDHDGITQQRFYLDNIKVTK